MTTDGYSDWRTRPLPEGHWIMRPGKKIPRNLYIEFADGRSEPVGQVDSAPLAKCICDAVNLLLHGTTEVTWPDPDPGDTNLNIRNKL